MVALTPKPQPQNLNPQTTMNEQKWEKSVNNPGKKYSVQAHFASSLYTRVTENTKRFEWPGLQVVINNK